MDRKCKIETYVFIGYSKEWELFSINLYTFLPYSHRNQLCYSSHMSYQIESLKPKTKHLFSIITRAIEWDETRDLQ